MKKNNYVSKNFRDAEIILSELLKIYKKIEKIKKKKDDNIVGVLFHELMYFLVSKRCQSNLKSLSNIDDSHPSISFGKRKNIPIYTLKKNSFIVSNLLKIYSIFSYLFNYKKKLFIGKSISLSFKNKFLLLFFCFTKKYKIILDDTNENKLIINEETERIFLNEIKRILIQQNLSLKILKDIKNFVKKIKTKKETKYKEEEKNLIITGTLGNFQNRLIAIKKIRLNAKLLIVNHIPTFGFVSYSALKYDEFYLCDYYLTPGSKKKIYNDYNYKGINNENYKILLLENKNSKFSSNTIKKIDFNKIKTQKILYVPNRTVNSSLNGDYLYKKDYENWQNYLFKKFGKIDAKFPYKKFNYKVNNEFNIVKTDLKLIEICKNYDLIIIDFISSSTFGELASTNVPILYFNLGRDCLSKYAKKVVKSRVHEIKIDIFNNFKGLEQLDKLKNFQKTKNIFKNIYIDNGKKKSFYQNLIDIDKKL